MILLFWKYEIFLVTQVFDNIETITQLVFQNIATENATKYDAA